MTEELNLSELFSNLVKFISRNGRMLFVFMLIGVISIIGYQKLKPPFYETKAICTSGVSEYERQEQVEDLSQRTAIDLINHLQINIDNKDYSALALSLGLDVGVASCIKKIEAEQLYQQDMNEKFYALNKFEISLITYNNDQNTKIKSGLIYYFENNQYISHYYKSYKQSCGTIINDINDEIKFINQIRAETNMKSLVLGSTNTISGDDRRLSNEIIALSHMREEIKANFELLKPLSFVKDFANVNQKEDDVLVLGILGAILSFILGLFVALVKEAKIN
tara:strand:+ start:2595 stop:3431 length:837 start_codon:yes stop_codon:yes gene_type:complete